MTFTPMITPVAVWQCPICGNVKTQQVSHICINGQTTIPNLSCDHGDYQVNMEPLNDHAKFMENAAGAFKHASTGA